MLQHGILRRSNTATAFFLNADTYIYCLAEDSSVSTILNILLASITVREYRYPTSGEMTTTSITSFDQTMYFDYEDYRKHSFHLNPVQSISGRNIDQAKLRTVLRSKFGAGAYDILVRLGYFS